MSMQTRVVIVDVKFCNGDADAIAESVNQKIAECEEDGWKLRGVPQYYTNEYAVWLTFERENPATDDSEGKESKTDDSMYALEDRLRFLNDGLAGDK